MFSLIQLKGAILDSGISGISPLDAALLFVLVFGVPLIPYAIFYLALLEKRPRTPEAAGAGHGLLAKLTGWMHVHRHPQLLHH